MAYIDGVRRFLYTGKSGNTLTGCNGWVGTPTNFAAGAKVLMQSIDNAGASANPFGNGRQRAQIGSHDFGGQNWWPMVHGQTYILYLSIRFAHPTPIPDNTNTHRDQVLQYKQYPQPTGYATNPNPLFAIRERRDYIEYVRYGEVRDTIAIDRSVGWIRFAFAWHMNVSDSLGKFRMWADLDGEGDLLPVTQEFTEATLTATGGQGFLSFGPYAGLTAKIGGRDYANAQLCSFSGF